MTLIFVSLSEVEGVKSDFDYAQSDNMGDVTHIEVKNPPKYVVETSGDSSLLSE